MRFKSEANLKLKIKKILVALLQETHNSVKQMSEFVTSFLSIGLLPLKAKMHCLVKLAQPVVHDVFIIVR